MLGARNDYLLAIQTANAHQSQYYHTWLQKCLTGQWRSCTLFLPLTWAGAGTECGVHGAVADYISILSTTELATCNAQHVSLNGGLSRQHHVSRVVCPLVMSHVRVTCHVFSCHWSRVTWPLVTCDAQVSRRCAGRC